MHHSSFVPVPRLEMENVEAVIPLLVGPGGRISGLTDYVGKRVLVVVPADEPASRAARRGGR